MARPIEFDENGRIIVDKPKKAIVRFPTEEEYARGIDEVPRAVRLKEYQERVDGGSK